MATPLVTQPVRLSMAFDPCMIARLVENSNSGAVLLY